MLSVFSYITRCQWFLIGGGVVSLTSITLNLFFISRICINHWRRNNIKNRDIELSKKDALRVTFADDSKVIDILPSKNYCNHSLPNWVIKEYLQNKNAKSIKNI